jgi:hypothetical protein
MGAAIIVRNIRRIRTTPYRVWVALHVVSVVALVATAYLDPGAVWSWSLD